MSNTVQPRLLKGFQDHLPGQMIARQRIIQTVRECYERFGFLPLDTPAQEYALTLLGPGGEESNKQIFRFSNPENEDIGLRYDLTVPLARVVAMYPDLPKPFRRYQVGTLWRAEKPDPGRYREFIQFDLDAVGCPDVLTDAEIILAMHDTLQALGIERFVIHINNRKVLNAAVAHAGIPAEKVNAVIRVIDKLEKIGIQDVMKELADGRVDASGDRIRGLGLEPPQIKKLCEFLEIPSGTRTGVLKNVSQVLSDCEAAQEGIEELNRIAGYLDAVSVAEDLAIIDPTLARGLDYYTGPIFETTLPDAPRFGSVFSGGRYDNLIRRFSDEEIPATGASVGIDRLLAALDSLGLIPDVRCTARVLVTVMDDQHKGEYLRMAQELRHAGIPTELYTGTAKGLGKQLKYANALGMDVAVIAGGDEFTQGTVSIKDLGTGMAKRKQADTHEEWKEKGTAGQQTVKRDQLVETVRAFLG
ncbi:MAG TPA: histidine--tRNA ligase [bacterium]|nr:histidine--tRNA ligase [bacterium]HQO35419.1 histidine--tRNA ligase [bacterium]HQP98226.1 histidine--tRNA ligase [bacterium]